MLLRFVSVEFEGEDRETKGRLVRAQLSPYELALVFLYSAQLKPTDTEPQPEEFRELAAKFELFQSLLYEVVDAASLLAAFDERAFGSNTELLRKRSKYAASPPSGEL